MPRALFIGRFQPFHLGHFRALEWILSREDEVIVGIGSAQRSFEPENPFTAGERALMVWSTLRAANVLERVLIVMIPDTFFEHSKWVCNVKTYSPPFEVIYTNDELSKLLLEEAGLNVEPIPFFERNKYSGTLIRSLMAKRDETWRSLVPAEVANVIDSINGEERVYRIFNARKSAAAGI